MRPVTLSAHAADARYATADHAVHLNVDGPPYSLSTHAFLTVEQAVALAHELLRAAAEAQRRLNAATTETTTETTTTMEGTHG
jgi:hypothetical protein